MHYSKSIFAALLVNSLWLNVALSLPHNSVNRHTPTLNLLKDGDVQVLPGSVGDRCVADEDAVKSCQPGLVCMPAANPHLLGICAYPDTLFSINGEQCGSTPEGVRQCLPGLVCLPSGIVGQDVCKLESEDDRPPSVNLDGPAINGSDDNNSGSNANNNNNNDNNNVMMDPGNPILPADMDPLFGRPLVDMQPSVPFTTLTHGNPAKHHDIVVPDPSSNPLPHAPMKSTGPHRPNAGPTPVNLRPHAPPPSDFPQTVFPAHPPPSGSRPKHHGGRHHSGRTPPHAAHTISRGSSNHHKHHHTSPAGKATPTKAAPLPNSAHEKAPTGIVAVNEILTRPTSAVSEAPNGRQIPELTPVFKHSEEKDRPLTEHMPSFHTATPLSPERITAPVRPSMPDLMPTMDHEFIPLNAVAYSPPKYMPYPAVQPMDTVVTNPNRPTPAVPTPIIESAKLEPAAETPAPTVQSVHSPAASSSPMIQSNSHPAPQETPIEHTIATATPIPAKATPLHRPDTTTITSQEPAANTPVPTPPKVVVNEPKEEPKEEPTPSKPAAVVATPINSPAATVMDPPKVPEPATAAIHPGLPPARVPPSDPSNSVTATAPAPAPAPPNTPVTFPLLINPNIQFPNFMPMMPANQADMPIMPANRPNMPMMPPRRPNMPMMPPHRPNMPMMPPRRPNMPMMPPHRPSMPMMPPHQPSFMEHSPSPFDEMDLMPSHPRSNDWSNALMDDNSSDFSMNDDDDLEDDPDSDAWDDDLDDE